MKKACLARASLALSKLQHATTQEEIFYALSNAAFGAYDLGQLAQAEAISHKAIQLASTFEDDWNCGNAVFSGHTVLGLIALHRGDVEQAIQELHASAQNSGSPQLGSFGPTMRLAKELLKHGRQEDVIAFLRKCLAFWKMGDAWVQVWEKKIRRGQTPNFLMNLHT